MRRGLLRKEDEEPTFDHFHFYFDAFQELSSCRVSSMSLGPIPFTAIVEYSRIYNVEDVEDFHFFIRLMDNTLLRLEAAKQKARGENNGRDTGKTDPNKSGYSGG